MATDIDTIVIGTGPNLLNFKAAWGPLVAKSCKSPIMVGSGVIERFLKVLMQILAGLLLLGVLITFHELGHFLFAKWLGGEGFSIFNWIWAKTHRLSAGRN